jgi:hypothetical protein
MVLILHSFMAHNTSSAKADMTVKQNNTIYYVEGADMDFWYHLCDGNVRAALREYQL